MLRLLLPSEAAVLPYLQRIGLDGPVSMDLQGLTKLLHAQLTHVPFENLDIWNSGTCPSLDVEDLYHKIVLRRRGGYCFELNTLFRALLNSLGFDAYQVIASLVDENGVAAPPAHNAIICLLDGEKYFLDVGFGGPVPYVPLKLNLQQQDNFRLDQKNDFYYLMHCSHGEENFVIRFRDVEAEPVELIPLNFYISQKTDIHFRHILRVNQRKGNDVVYSLVDHEFKIFDCFESTIQRVEGTQMLQDILKTYFDIDWDTTSLNKQY